jgi:CheY-like chemotaxis protein
VNGVAPKADWAPQTVKIVIAEDEVLLRLTVADVLRGEGFQVFEAADVDEAISILASTPDVHVVITDMHMQAARDGMRLANYVRARCPGVLPEDDDGPAAP